MALIVGGVFWPNMEQRSGHLVGPEKTIDDSDGALLLNAYHLYRWYLTV